jgi:endonuclease/exonuclease/phosphatase family metal-dependent hydrolase
MPSIRILCLNLYRGRVSPARLDGLLEEVVPDVAVFQELTPSLAEVVSRRFAHGSLHPAAAAAGRGIGSIRPVESGMLEVPDRPAPTALLHPEDWPQLAHPLSLINLHMTHPLAFPPWRSARQRAAQIDGVLDHAGRNGDLVVLGDLNAGPGWPSYRRLRRHLDDAATVAADRHGRRPAMTWSLRPGGRGLMRLDHILARGVSVRDVATIPVESSDHRAIVADVDGAVNG